MTAFLIILIPILVVLAALSRTKALDGFASAFGSPTAKIVPAVAEPNGAPPAHRTSHANRRPATD
jgi:hypothetical protein